jgi:hypothetical protein
MLSYQWMGVAQPGQCERGVTTLSPWGRREMQTLRKLPIRSPRTEAGRRKASKSGISV